jgi:hypothetical protein
MKAQMTAAQIAMIPDLANDLRPTVAKIESSIPTTRGHYGRYGSLLSQLSNGNATSAAILVLALIEAGANAQGAKDGFKTFC